MGMITSELDRLVDLIVNILKTEHGVRRAITPKSQLCNDLGVCDDDIDDVMLDALRHISRRPLMVGEPGSEDVVFDPQLTVEGLAQFMLEKCPKA
jgi:hypothetical protein